MPVRAPAAYVPYLSHTFVATGTNTGNVTMGIVGVSGTKPVRKIKAGAIAELDAGDIVTGGLYRIDYDGTQYQLASVASSGLSIVKQGDLSTSTQAFSLLANNLIASSLYLSTSAVVMSGGSYGFRLASGKPGVSLCGWWEGDSLGGSYSASSWSMQSGVTVNGNQRYVNTSPPFDLGEGEAAGFFFAMVDEGSGEITGYSVSDTPPWAYNGPTDIRPEEINPITGVRKRRDYLWTGF